MIFRGSLTETYPSPLPEGYKIICTRRCGRVLMKHHNISMENLIFIPPSIFYSLQKQNSIFIIISGDKYAELIKLNNLIANKLFYEYASKYEDDALVCATDDMKKNFLRQFEVVE